MAQQDQKAHPGLSTGSSLRNKGPTPYHLQYDLAPMLGPFKVIDHISCEEEWAHPMLSASSLSGSTGPIQSHRRLLLWYRLGPPHIIGIVVRLWL